MGFTVPPQVFDLEIIREWINEGICKGQVERTGADELVTVGAGQPLILALQYITALSVT